MGCIAPAFLQLSISSSCISILIFPHMLQLGFLLVFINSGTLSIMCIVSVSECVQVRELVGGDNIVLYAYTKTALRAWLWRKLTMSMKLQSSNANYHKVFVFSFLIIRSRMISLSNITTCWVYDRSCIRFHNQSVYSSGSVLSGLTESIC